MSLAVAIQMDPVETIDIEADSTFVLGVEALARGYALFHYLPQDLSFKDGSVYARMRPLDLRREQGRHWTLGEPRPVALNEMDVVLMRQDPPFDMAYITATHLLEQIHDLMPPTLITSDREEVRAFREEQKDLIIKPLFGNGGAGVFHIPPGDENLNALLELFTDLYREPIIVQRYLPSVREGDKRIILIEGEAVGVINRVPPPGEARSNMHVGGRPEKAVLDKRDREICEAIGPTLREKGLVFVGIDVIGGFMTEINVTSPTGLQEINRFDGVSLEARIWDSIEARRAKGGRHP
jgi:glutathione synthase